MPDFDLVVIGAGAAGLSTAALSAALGLKVALVERAEMGGDCLNRGCVPSKALLAAAHAAAAAAKSFPARPHRALASCAALCTRTPWAASCGSGRAGGGNSSHGSSV